ncbi:hypothetical protein LTR70_005067 [Exophiala xenobiotica]|uniref:Formate/nitrite transporter n=1 Tax=Lithohypha guttulata TaxID=1690604 RepID=A0ABR0K955_9EURO|nr:hypothetical protein LTR24_005543 [Lithohypha guttulata]KAK5319314.1 hypothetical protein LTR70_005067 [Exophiala xenobiotica]
MDKANGHPPQELARLVSRAGLAKARLGYPEYVIKSFLGGVFISLGALADLVVAAGAPGLRESNPGVATMLAAFIFPMGFVLVILCNVELATSNMFVMIITTLQRKTSIWDLTKNWVISYTFNLAGCLFFAGFLAWWSDTLDSDTATAYAVTQAEGRVNVQWSVNLLRGVGCNWLVALAFFLSIGSKDYISKIYSIWIPIWVFVLLGYQHSIANFFLVPIGMFYGTNFGTGKFIYQSVIPVTLGNIIGGSLFGGAAFWYLYGRNEGIDSSTGQPLNAQQQDKDTKKMEKDRRVNGGDPGRGQTDGFQGPYDRNNMVDAV